MRLDRHPWNSGDDTTRSSQNLSRIALIGNFPPRRCGLATYTSDTRDALEAHPSRPTVDLYIIDDGQVAGYSDAVSMIIPQDDITAYQTAADTINASDAQIAWVQHEFGIFGGEAGSHLLALINRLAIPVALTLHTVLAEPTDAQRRVLQALIDRAAVIIVMAEKGREILLTNYRIDNETIRVIPHGVPDRAMADPVAVRARLGLPQRPTILTFGLLAPEKGIIDMIDAMVRICQAHPDAHYIVLGATHPHLLAREQETHRTALKNRVVELRLENNVSFVDRFVDQEELLDWLAAADIYVTPYHNPNQITSGTLSYAVALGKPVVSTSYIHATEILADGHGCLVPFRAPKALSDVVGSLLENESQRSLIGNRAYARGRSMIWSRNADAALEAMRNALTKKRILPDHLKMLPVLKSEPIARMTDDTGMFQHSILNVPDRRHGYCIDDNARGLLLMSLAEDLPLDQRVYFSNIYASFLQHGWNPDLHRFRNFMGYDRRWLEDVGSEDSNGRTLWSLAIAATAAPSESLRSWAAHWFDLTLPHFTELQSPRAMAFVLLAAAEMSKIRLNNAVLQRVLRQGAGHLIGLVSKSRRPDWQWFEIVLSYDNTRLPEALIRAGLLLDDAASIEIGLETLRWITAKTMTSNGQFQPVGTASFGQPFATPAVFDQQPLEAWAMIDACALAFGVTNDPVWLSHAEAAHDWFTGGNTLSLSLIDPKSGECADGLTPFDINGNHGAESVIAWQAAHRAYRQLVISIKPRQELAEHSRLAG